MRQFDWKRFRMMLLWTYGNNKGNLLRMGAIMTIAFFLCEEFVAGMTLVNSGDGDIDFVGGIRGLGELKKRVDSGEMKVALALYPVSMKQLMDIADTGNIMPPKTTWFEPKLRSGLVIHKLD